VRAGAGSIRVPADPADEMYLAAALEGRAGFVVSGDSHLLSLGELHRAWSSHMRFRIAERRPEIRAQLMRRAHRRVKGLGIHWLVEENDGSEAHAVAGHDHLDVELRDLGQRVGPLGRVRVARRSASAA
jgi:hypothetical protein